MTSETFIQLLNAATGPVLFFVAYIFAYGVIRVYFEAKLEYTRRVCDLVRDAQWRKQVMEL